MDLPGKFDGFAIEINGGTVDGEAVAGQAIADVELAALVHAQGQGHLRGAALVVDAPESDADLRPWQVVRNRRGARRAAVAEHHDAVEPAKQPANPFAAFFIEDDADDASSVSVSERSV